MHLQTNRQPGHLRFHFRCVEVKHEASAEDRPLTTVLFGFAKLTGEKQYLGAIGAALDGGFH
jgi:hypothetical protein